MRKQYILYYLVAALSVLSCGTKVEPELFCELTLSLATEDGARVASMTVSSSLEGNQCRNLNTGMNYTYPVFKDNEALLRVQKGVYLLSFDAVATLEDGSTRSVRHYGHADPQNAVNLLSGRETLTLELVYLD